tara:strand:- start:411 stop:743 length:333 start_codon:yes stop_codon:yes gene_type:complete
MANAFTRKLSSGIGTSPTAVGSYTVGGGVVATVIGLYVTNITTALVLVSANIDVSGTNYFLLKDAPLPPGASIAVVGGDAKVVLVAGDKIEVTSSAASSVDAILSVLEQS